MKIQNSYTQAEILEQIQDGRWIDRPNGRTRARLDLMETRGQISLVEMLVKAGVTVSFKYAREA